MLWRDSLQTKTRLLGLLGICVGLGPSLSTVHLSQCGVLPSSINLAWRMIDSGAQACLVLVEKRETRYRVMWYYRLFEETQRGLTRYPNSLEHIHGSLLALGELLRHTGAPSCLSGRSSLPYQQQRLPDG